MVISLGHTLRGNLVAAVRGTKNLQMPRQERETLLSLLTFVECTSAIVVSPRLTTSASLTGTQETASRSEMPISAVSIPQNQELWIPIPLASLWDELDWKESIPQRNRFHLKNRFFLRNRFLLVNRFLRKSNSMKFIIIFFSTHFSQFYHDNLMITI